MGYSASVACKSIKYRDKLSEFLENNLVPWSKLTQGTKFACDYRYDYTRFVRIGDDIGYGASLSRVGFNFSTQGYIGPYMWAILKWSAIRAGRFAHIKAQNNIIYSRYVTYDGIEHIPVLLSSEYPNTKWSVDSHGCEPLGEGCLEWLNLNKAKLRKRLLEKEQLISKAMHDLSAKWIA